jgi:hypothetical protein
VCSVSNSDLRLARALLDGYVEQDSRGRLRTKYPKKGSPEETAALRELAEHLRSDSPVDRGIRMSLAAFFDRPKGRPTNPIRNTQIAAHVYAEMQRGERYTDATASAAEKFCLSQGMIEKIYGRYRAYGPLLTGGMTESRSAARMPAEAVADLGVIKSPHLITVIS